MTSGRKDSLYSPYSLKQISINFIIQKLDNTNKYYKEEIETKDYLNNGEESTNNIDNINDNIDNLECLDCSELRPSYKQYKQTLLDFVYDEYSNGSWNYL